VYFTRGKCLTGGEMRTGFGEFVEWCGVCQLAFRGSEAVGGRCPVCGGEVVKGGSLCRREREAFLYESWVRDVKARGEWGPSPGGAAAMLGCTRQMVGHLVKIGVLVRNEYRVRLHADSWFKVPVAYISERSVRVAIENRERTGNLTGGSKKKS
jgi:hypothetical protein